MLFLDRHRRYQHVTMLFRNVVCHCQYQKQPLSTSGVLFKYGVYAHPDRFRSLIDLSLQIKQCLSREAWLVVSALLGACDTLYSSDSISINLSLQIHLYVLEE